MQMSKRREATTGCEAPKVVHPTTLAFLDAAWGGGSGREGKMRVKAEGCRFERTAKATKAAQLSHLSSLFPPLAARSDTVLEGHLSDPRQEGRTSGWTAAMALSERPQMRSTSTPAAIS